MKFDVLTIPPFDKQFKRLAKKYPSLKGELKKLGENISLHPTSGSALGHGCFKIRLAIASKGKGKSGGARIITMVKIIHHRIYLLSIYDKSEKADINSEELDALIKIAEQEK